MERRINHRAISQGKEYPTLIILLAPSIHSPAYIHLISIADWNKKRKEEGSNHKERKESITQATTPR